MRRIAAWMLVLALVFGMSATALAYDTYKLDENANGIKELQQRLIDLEYLDGKADGWFGKKTQAAVKRFQLVHDQEVTGIADDAMQQALYSDDAKKFPQVVMSLNELKDMMGEAGALGIRYDLSALESDGRSASCELNNYVVLNCDLLGDDITELQLVGTQNVKIPFTMLLMALDKSISQENMFDALSHLIEEQQRVVDGRVIRYEEDDKGVQRLIVTPMEKGESNAD